MHVQEKRGVLPLTPQFLEMEANGGRSLKPSELALVI